MTAKAIANQGKVAVHLCTKAGNSPYNKGGYIAQVDEERIVDRYDYKGGEIIILRPIIDKLIFEYRFKDCGSQAREVKESTLINAMKLVEKMPSLFKVASNSNVGFKRNYYLRMHYEHNYVLIYKPTGAKIIIQLQSRHKNGAFMNCDLNPARLGPKGMDFFRDAIKLLTANDFYEISFETMAAVPKSLKRIDIAVDILGVDASDLEARYVFKGKILKKNVIQNPTGRAETQQFMLPKTDKNEAYWYNKKQAMKDLSKEDDPLDGGQTPPYGQGLYTRFEYRIEDTEKPISNLHSFANHLKKVHFRAVDFSKIAGKNYTHPLFLRYAILRTCEKALEMIPTEKREEYSASYKAAMLDIWDPEKIWGEGWPRELVSLGLYNPAPKKKKGKK